MINLLYSLAICSLIVVLSGCATLSKDECRSANWQTIGFEDGGRGYSSQRISQHREACAEYGITPILDDYLAGHKRGVRKYCQPQRGFELGRSGSKYNGICPADLEPLFLTQYRQGQEIHKVEDSIKSLEREQRTIISERDDLIDEIATNESMIVSDNTSPAVRQELLVQNRKIEQLIEEKEIEIDQLGRQISRLEREVSRLLGRR